VASKLLERYPKLVTEENNGGLIPLQMLAQFCEFSQGFPFDFPFASIKWKLTLSKTNN